jgi:hypothetical protein
MTASDSKPEFVVCVDNRGHALSLERKRVYRCKSDDAAASRGLLRVIDESGEDYLYPREMFEPVTMSEAARLSRRRR